MLALALLLACPAKRSYPDAEQRLDADLSAPVEVLIDSRGVPHVYAETLSDAYLAVGFMHARDRGFQLELVRKAASGRLTELFGEGLLDVDRRLRVLSYQIEALEANLPPVERERAQAYADGVNRGLAELPEPMEFRLLKHEPEPWTVRDVLLVARLQAWDLSHDMVHELVRDRLRALVDAETLRFLTQPSVALGASILEPDPSAWPVPPGQAPPPQAPPLAGQPALAQADVAHPIEITENLSPPGELIVDAVVRWREDLDEGCSNAWAVHGSRTASGRPHLAGDPHLDLSSPNIFYEVHLVTPEVDVAGATFPGMPMVVIGRGAHVAWSLTVSYLDVQDLYVITPDPPDPGRYLLDGESLPFERRTETFRVSDDEVLTEDFLATEFGPLINPGREGEGREGVLYALSWTGFDTRPLIATRAFEAMAAAETGVEAMGAAALLRFPSQNWVFATANGDIGWVLGGTLPRAQASPLPLDGSVRPPPPEPPAERPRVLNPPQGYVVGSNQPPWETGNPGTRYSGPYRALRATMALHEAETWSTADSRGLQMDTLNLEAVRVAPLLLAAVEGVSLSPLEQGMVDALAAWDHQMRKELAGPLVYEAWRGATHRALAALRIPDPEVARAWLLRRHSEQAMEEALFTEAGRRWWDDPRTVGVETREQALRGALAVAAAELSEAFGADPSRWTWGAAHQLVLEHPFAAKRVLQPWFGVEPVPVDGGRHVQLAFGHRGVVGEYESTNGPVERQVVEPGGEASFVLAAGNAGQPGHPYAFNQLDDWLVNRQHRTDLQAGDLVVAARVTLAPR